MKEEEAIAWLYSTQTFGIKLGLEGARCLLRDYLAYPSHRTKVIHVAGTNGKGSTCAFIDAIARASGLRTGLFTSPHLVDFRERAKVNGIEISSDDCLRHLCALRQLCESRPTHPTFFEIVLALAMRHFYENECELLILETGMGGRLDATTAVPADVAVITPIDLDHQEWLGNTIAAIASEKAGIICDHKPVVVSPQHPEAMAVLRATASQRHSELIEVTEPLRGYSLSLIGVHQPWNAAVAVAALHALKLPLHYQSVQYGLAHTHWPGRFEKRDLAPGQVMVLDGAHNPHAAATLAQCWIEFFGEAKPVLLFAAVDSKDVSGVLKCLAPLAAEIWFCAMSSPRALSTAELHQHLPDHTLDVRDFSDAGTALAAARAQSRHVLVAGSLYLVGEVTALLNAGPFQSSSQ